MFENVTFFSYWKSWIRFEDAFIEKEVDIMVLQELKRSPFQNLTL